MPTTLSEMMDSRSFREERGPDGQTRLASMTLHFKLEGTADETVARTLLQAGLPTAYGDLERSSFDVEPGEFVDTETDEGIWDVTAEYTLPEEEDAQTGDSLYSFDTTGGTQHLTQSLETVGKYKPGGTPPGHGGAINVTGHGANMTVEGVDVTMPLFAWTETHYLPDALVTDEYISKLYALTGKTNAAQFRGCAIGEALFLGATGSKRTQGDWEIGFRFAGSPNTADARTPELTAAGFTQAIPKKGWEFIWTRYGQVVDSDELIATPIEVFVEKVYKAGNYSDLAIGA